MSSLLQYFICLGFGIDKLLIFKNQNNYVNIKFMVQIPNIFM